MQADPQVEQRLKKSHRIDAVIGQSLHDVPIPDGLEQRLWAALSAGQPQLACIDSAARSQAQDSIVQPIAGPWFARNRWKVWLSVAASVAAALVLAVWVWMPGPQLASDEDVANQSQRWLANLSNSNWTRFAAPNARFPLPQSMKPYREQLLSGTRSSLEAMCYDLSPDSRGAPLLFVCPYSSSTDLHPNQPFPVASGKWHVGGWQSRGLVLVLAVRGSSKEYHQYRDLLLRKKQSYAWKSRLQVRT
jgi:hypothetical protein